jgi:hypothetical protein
MKKILFAIVICIMAGCNEPVKDDEPVIIDSAQGAENIGNEDRGKVFSADNLEWLESVLPPAMVTPKSIELEEFWNLDSFDLKEFSPSPDFYKTYRSVLRWSPDSAKVLDIGSYGSIPVKDARGNVRLEGGEPDSEVALVLPRSNQRARLMFVGPSSQILDGRWINDHELIVVGTSDFSAQKRDTLLWMINVSDKFFRLYNFNNR